MLRIILGIVKVNGRPIISNAELYKQLGLLNVRSVYQHNLFKLLRLLLDGELPEFWNILLTENLTACVYSTRQSRFWHLALVCEVERRALPHQLILLHECIPKTLLEMNFTTSLKLYKKSLLDSQWMFLVWSLNNLVYFSHALRLVLMLIGLDYKFIF